MKILLIVCIAFIFLIIIAFLLLPWMIDTDKYRKELIASLESATGKEVNIEEIGIGLRKGIEVYALDLSFREPGNKGAHALFRAKRVGAGIELLPLMRKDINITSLHVDSPDINSVPYLLNLFVPFLMNGKGEKKDLIRDIPSSGREGEASSSEYSSFTVDISRLDTIALRGGTMILSRGIVRDSDYPLILHDFFMKIKRSKNSPQASVELEASLQEYSGDIKMKGTVGTPDLDRGIPMHLLWHINIEDASIIADEIREIAGIPVTGGKINFSTVVEGSFGTELKLSGNGKITDLLSEKTQRDREIEEALNGHVSYTARMRRGILDIQTGTFTTGQSKILFHGSINLTMQDPQLCFAVNGNDLRYSDVVPIFSLVGIRPPAGLRDGFLDCAIIADHGLQGVSPPLISGNLNLKRFRIVNPLLVSPLEDLECTIKISGQTVEILDMKANFQDERITGNISFRQLSPPDASFSFAMFGGDFSGSFHGSPSAQHALTIDADISRAKANLLVAAFSPSNKNVIFGDLNGRVHLKTSEIFFDGVPEAFQGEIDLQILKGRIPTVSLLKQVASVLKTIGGRGFGKEETEFDRIEGHFKIREGRALTNDFLFRSRDVDCDGAGIYRFGSKLDFNLNASFSPEVSGDMVQKTPILKFRMDTNGRVSIPLKITGTIAKLQVAVDLDEILKDKKTMDLFQSLREFLK